MPSQESVKRSIAHNAIGSLGSNAISLTGFVVLARMLTPAEFGLMAAIGVLVGASQIVVDLGLSAALVQNQNTTEKHLGAVFLVHVLMGAIFAFLMLAFSEAAEDFFDLSGLSPLAEVCSWLFILNAVSMVPVSLLEKNGQFIYVAKVELFSTLLSTLLSIFLAWIGYGVWALVAGLYCLGVVRAVLVFYYSGWKPRFLVGRGELAELWVYSRYLVAMQAYNYVAANIDKVLISRYLGAHTLGAFRYGERISQLPVMLVNKVFSRVLFPAFSSYQHDKIRIKYQYLKSIRMVSFVTFPVMLGFSIISDHIVLTLLGSNWSEMVIILPMLVISFLLTSVGVLNVNIYKALGRTKRLLKISIVLRLNLVFCAFVGIQFGLVGILIGLIVARFINFIPALYLAGQLINTSIKDVVASAWRALISSGVMVGVIYAAENMLALTPGRVVPLIAVVVIGVVSYGACSLAIQRKTLNEMGRLIRT